MSMESTYFINNRIVLYFRNFYAVRRNIAESQETASLCCANGQDLPRKEFKNILNAFKRRTICRNQADLEKNAGLDHHPTWIGSRPTLIIIMALASATFRAEEERYLRNQKTTKKR